MECASALFWTHLAEIQPNHICIQPTSDGLQPQSDGLQPTKLAMASNSNLYKSDGLQPTTDDKRHVPLTIQAILMGVGSKPRHHPEPNGITSTSPHQSTLIHVDSYLQPNAALDLTRIPSTETLVHPSYCSRNGCFVWKWRQLTTLNRLSHNASCRSSTPAHTPKSAA